MPLAVCATPIGNLADVTLRVLDELREADAVLCEDTRHTQVLLDRYGIRARRLVSLHRHNEVRRVAELVPLLLAGERHALVSDAGLPGVNDPGGRLLAAALEAGVPVSVLPGPSAVETALVASGLGAAEYRFLGYLPRREAELAALWHDGRTWPYAAVAFESPKRLPRSLASLAAIDPERRVAVCRELTKHFEEVARGTAAELAGRFAEPPKGEVTVVLAPGSADDDRSADAVAAVQRLVAGGAPRRLAADVVSGLARSSRNELYRASLDRPVDAVRRPR
jgi:16S rRNA (cytidine1402-2'-O)-methyltransferase